MSLTGPERHQQTYTRDSQPLESTTAVALRNIAMNGDSVSGWKHNKPTNSKQEHT